MDIQVRVYRIEAGKLETFADEWRRQIAPLRRAFGFEILGAWASREDETFVWVLGHAGDFAEADRAYYASDERAALDPDPARHVVEPRAFRASAVPLP